MIYDANTQIFVGPDSKAPFSLKSHEAANDTFRCIEHLNLPIGLKQVYSEQLGVSHFFDWQKESLRELPQILEEGGFQNFIYSAPTSAGKTIVSELLMLSKLWKCRDQNPLSIIVLPYVSLISEKELRLQKLAKSMQFGHSHLNL